MDNVHDNDELAAERILEERFNEDNQLQYLIKWEEEDEEYATWESYDEVTQSWPHLLRQFNQNKRKPRKKDIIVIDEAQYPTTSYYHHTQLTPNEYDVDVPSHSSTSTTSSPTIRYNSRSSSSNCHRYNALQAQSSTNLSPHPHTPSISPAAAALAAMKANKSTNKPTINRIATNKVYVKTEPFHEEYTVKRSVITLRKEIHHPIRSLNANKTLQMKHERATIHTNHAPVAIQTQVPPAITAAITAIVEVSTNEDKSTSNSLSANTAIAKHDADTNENETSDVAKDSDAVIVQNVTDREIEIVAREEQESSENTETVYKPKLQLDFDVHHNEIARIQREEEISKQEEIAQNNIELDIVENEAKEEQEQNRCIENKTDGNNAKQQTNDEDDIQMKDTNNNKMDDSKINDIMDEIETEETNVLETNVLDTMQADEITNTSLNDTEAQTVTNEAINTNTNTANTTDEIDIDSEPNEDCTLKPQKREETQKQIDNIDIKDHCTEDTLLITSPSAQAITQSNDALDENTNIDVSAVESKETESEETSASTNKDAPKETEKTTHEAKEEETIEDKEEEAGMKNDTSMDSFEMNTITQIESQSNDHPLMRSDNDETEANETKAVAPEAVTVDTNTKEANHTDATEAVNQHNSESDDTESENVSNASDQAQAPSITQLTSPHLQIKSTDRDTSSNIVEDNVNISSTNSNTSSPTSATSPSTNQQFQDHLPSLNNNPSMTDVTHHNNNTPNPSIIQPHYLTHTQQQLQHPLNPPNNNPNNNTSNLRKHQAPNQQYTLLHLGPQPTFGPHELNSFHSLYIPPSSHHHIDSTMDSNSEYNNHQSINTDSTNSSQTQTHSTIHSSGGNPTATNHHHHNTTTTNISITTNPPNPPTHGIFMPSINPPPPHNLHRHHSAPIVSQSLTNGINHNQQQAAPPPLPPMHQLTHFSTVPVVTRIPLPMAGSGPPSAQHPVLLSPANANVNTNTNTVTPPNTSSISGYNANNNAFENHANNEEHQNASSEFHHQNNSAYYNEAASNQPQSSSNSINSLSQQCPTYNGGDFQNVNFQQIKANGAPYNCPFCDTLSFQTWADWKQHWYQLHNSKYFDDASKMKTQKTKAAPFHSNMLSNLKSFPPQPTNMVFQTNDTIQLLQSVNRVSNNGSNAKKRNHEAMTNAGEDEFAPRAKRQKISHSAYNNVNEETHKKSKKHEDDDYVVSHDDEDDDDEDEEEEDDDVSSVVSEANHKKRKHRNHHRNIKKKSKSKKSSRRKTILLDVKKKRGRGRPRKNDSNRKDNNDKNSKPKRKRGRPRKYVEKVVESDYSESGYIPKSTRSKRQKLNSEERHHKSGAKVAVCCKICNVNCTNNAGLSNHIRARHGMNKLRDYYSMNERAIKDKQNEMHYNDTNLLIGISPTHKSKNIKYKYKCTVCNPATAKFCAGHVGLNSHLRAHVKNGDLSDNEQKKLYKQIMKNPIPIYAQIPAAVTNVIDNTSTEDHDDDDESEASKPPKPVVDKPTNFKNEVIGDEEDEEEESCANNTTSDDDDDDSEPKRKLRSNKSKAHKFQFQFPCIRLPHKESENTPPCTLSPEHTNNDHEDAHNKQSKSISSSHRKKKNDTQKKDNLGMKSLLNIGRIPKKTPEQQKQQMLEQQSQSSILYPQRQKREFSPPDSPTPPSSSSYNKSNSKYRSNHYSSASHERQSSHSRSSSSSHSNSHSSHSRNYRDTKYRNNNHSRSNNNKNRRSKYNANRNNHNYNNNNNNSNNNNNNSNVSNPLYPDNYSAYSSRTHKINNNDDHHNVPALQPLHSPKHANSTNSHSSRKSQRHYYDSENQKIMAHYKYITNNNNDGSMNEENENNHHMIYDDHDHEHEVIKTPSSANSGTTTDDII